MNKNNKCLLLATILLSFVNCYAMFDGMLPVKKDSNKDNNKEIVYTEAKDNSSDEDKQVGISVTDLGTVTLDGSSVSKHNPATWATYLMDIKRGFLGNILHELEDSTFNEKAIENVKRVDAAVDEAIKYDNADGLSNLITKLKVIDFSIPKMTALNAQKYLENAIIRKEDQFTIDIKAKTTIYNDGMQKEYEQMMKIVLPAIVSYHQMIKKQDAALRGDVIDATSQLNLFKTAYNKTFQENYSSEVGYYTEQSLVHTTNTEKLVHDTFKTHAAVGQKLEKITSALHSLLLTEANT